MDLSTLDLSTLDLSQWQTGELGDYTEFRAQQNTDRLLAMLNGDLNENYSETKKGLSCRVYQQGVWGFAAGADIGQNHSQTLAKMAQRNAHFLASRQTKNEGDLIVNPFSLQNSFASLQAKAEVGDRIRMMEQVDRYIQEHCPKVTARSLHLMELDMEKALLLANGNQGYSFTPRTHLVFSITAENSQGQPVVIRDSIGGLGQYEDQSYGVDRFQPIIDLAYKHLLDKTKAVAPKGGKHTVVMDSRLAGILAHEAIGHTTEADLVLGGSVAGDLMGQQVASELVSLVDFAHSYQGETLPVPVMIDDEGVQANDTTIIEKGVLKSFLHNRESAKHFGVDPTGNARAFLYSDEPLIRMRNTAFLPGQDRLEDMIASIDNGYYLCRTSNGQADSTSEFMFGIPMGYEIKDGKLGRAITDTSISGVAFDVLKAVDMVSEEMTWWGYGMCGKKQPIPVGMGGPAIKAKLHVGGQ